eukprot:m.207063 g.207063  ORF g.207063 m.207063 type:complete len:831 (-) comp18511_c0_seq4:168-2660(-)
MLDVVEEQELNAVVKEYLTHLGYASTAQTFAAECLNKGTSVDSEQEQDTLDKLKTVHVLNDTMAAMEEGNFDEFYELWNTNVPQGIRESDATCLKLEFYTQIFFAIQPFHPRYSMLELSPEVTLPRFRSFLETKGAALSKTTEFLPFYALPFVPDPDQHPSFQVLFSNEWVPDLKARVETFLGPTIAAARKPRLFYLSKQNGSKSGSNEEYIEAIHQQISECEEREIQYIDRHNKLQREYHNLVGIAAELVEALESCLRGRMVTPSYLQDVAERLNVFGSQTLEPLTTIPPPTQQVLQRRVVLSKKLCTLDFDKINRDLRSLTERNKAILLQALRWRLTHAPPGQQRRVVVEAYIRNGILGGIDKNEILDLLASPSEVVREYLTRLYNCMASLSRCRGFMMENPELVERLHKVLVSEPGDTTTRQNVLGILQKLSLRRTAQSKMIQLGFINWIVGQLQQLPELSEYSVEYTVALMMNLCLRTAGKINCKANSSEKLGVLMDLLEHDNTQVRTYVHGTLYSLLSVPSIRDKAVGMGLEEVLEANMKVSDPALARQLEYILQQLHSTDQADIDEGSISDDGEDDDDDPEADEGEDLVTADAGEGEKITEAADACGEPLLAKEYAVDRPRTRAKSGRARPQSGGSDPPSRPVTPGSRRSARPPRPDTTVERPRTSASGERPSTGGPRHSRVSSAASTRGRTAKREDNPASRPPTGPGRRTGSAASSRPATGKRRHTGRPASGTDEAPDRDSDEERVLQKPPTPLDAEAASVLAGALGDRRVVAASHKAAPPSEKALEKLKAKEGSNIDAALEEHEAAFATRVRVPRTPVGHQH